MKYLINLDPPIGISYRHNKLIIGGSINQSETITDIMKSTFDLSNYRAIYPSRNKIRLEGLMFEDDFNYFIDNIMSYDLVEVKSFGRLMR